jgi:transcriptional regulator with XRE-family HTH domain
MPLQYTKTSKIKGFFENYLKKHKLNIAYIMNKSLGEVIRELRDKADLSLRDLAIKISKSAPFLSDIELGRRYPSDDVLTAIAKELSVTFDELKKYDNRESIADIKRMMTTNPQLGFAFRTAAEKLKTGNLTPEDFLKKLEEDKKDDGTKESK